MTCQFLLNCKRVSRYPFKLLGNWVDYSKHRNDAKNLKLLNNVETFIK